MSSKSVSSKASPPPSPPPSLTTDKDRNNNTGLFPSRDIDSLLKKASAPDASLPASAHLPPFLRRRVAFRDASHSESLKGLVAADGKTSSFVSYTPSPRNRAQSGDSGLANETQARDAALGFPVPQIDLFPVRLLTPFLKWRSIASIGPGLANLGNTCFLNSVLQCLLYTPPLAEFMRSREHSKQCSCNERIGDFCGFCALERQLHRHLESSKTSSQAVRPTDFVTRLKSIARHFRPGRQEDAHEFLRYLIEALQRACLRGSPPDLDARSKGTSVVHRIFGGHLQSTVACGSCRHVSRTFDPFLDLSLEVKQCDTLDAALRLFAAPEMLTRGNRYRCESCSRLTDARKQFSIFKTPEILTLQLKRFSVNPMTGQPGKIGRAVVFPELLDVSGVTSEGIVEEKKRRTEDGSLHASVYRLYAVIVHEGQSCNSGHYHAFVKNSSGVWYSMNDSSVHQVSLATVLQQRAYILFYQREESLQNTASSAKERRVSAERDSAARPPPKEKRSMDERMAAVRAASQLYTRTQDSPGTEEAVPRLVNVSGAAADVEPLGLKASSMWHTKTNSLQTDAVHTAKTEGNSSVPAYPTRSMRRLRSDLLKGWRVVPK
jgi:ubiquitin C-terminal hydrolase